MNEPTLSIDEMESVMREIESGSSAPPVIVVTPKEQTPTITEAPDLPPVTNVIPMPTDAQVTPPIRGVEGIEKEGAPAPTPAKSPIEAFVSAEKLAHDIRIDPMNLDQACVEHAALFVYYADQASKARRQYEKMKAAFEILESRLYAEQREKLTTVVVTEVDAKGNETKKPAKVTEAQIEAAVKADRRWWAGKNRLIDAQAIMDLAQNAKAAFEQRRDMIVQMGSDRRIERQGELRVRQVQSDREAALANLRSTPGNRG